MKIYKLSLALNIVLLMTITWLVFGMRPSARDSLDPYSEWKLIKTYIFLTYQWDVSSYLENQMKGLDLLSQNMRDQRLSELESEFEKVKLYDVRKSIEILGAIFGQSQGEFYIRLKSKIIEQEVAKDLEWIARVELVKNESALGWEITKFEALTNVDFIDFESYWLQVNKLSEIEIPCQFQSILEPQAKQLKYFLDVDKTSLFKFLVPEGNSPYVTFEIACQSEYLTLTTVSNNNLHTIYKNGKFLSWNKKADGKSLRSREEKQNLKSQVEKHFGIQGVNSLPKK